MSNLKNKGKNERNVIHDRLISTAEVLPNSTRWCDNIMLWPTQSPYKSESHEGKLTQPPEGLRLSTTSSLASVPWLSKMVSNSQWSSEQRKMRCFINLLSGTKPVQGDI